MNKILALLLLSMMPLFCAQAASSATAKSRPAPESAWQLAAEAYVYALPLVLTDATRRVSTNTDGTKAGRAPANQFNHATKLADASFRTVVTPNVDTVYSQAWLNILPEPVIYVMPEADRFFRMQVLDAWTNTAAVLDRAGVYAFTLPGWKGKLPKGVTRVNVPTATVWLLGRIVLSGQDDLPNVKTIQQGMKLMPLSAFVKGGSFVPHRGSYSAADEFVPVGKVLSMSPAEFFSTANALMKVNPPAAADAPLMKKLSAIGVGPGLTFSAALLGENPSARWKAMQKELRPQLTEASGRFSRRLGGWVYYGRPIGDFGTEYPYRAIIALAGLGANTVDVAIYPKRDTDENGAPLTGEKTYTLHFSSFPPVLKEGFWSVTAYGNDVFLIDNPLNRYCINDRTKLRKNDDGSVDIVLSKDAPSDTSNWLPAANGPYHLFMRIYLPDTKALETWKAPVIRRIN